MDNRINETIFELVDYLDTLGQKDKVEQEKGIQYINEVWDNLPIEKMEDSDRTLLALIVIDMCLKINNFSFAEKWIEIYLYEETYKPTINYHWGVLAFYKGDYKKAYRLFKEAQELSNGRELKGESKYLDLVENPTRFGVELN